MEDPVLMAREDCAEDLKAALIERIQGLLTEARDRTGSAALSERLQAQGAIECLSVLLKELGAEPPRPAKTPERTLHWSRVRVRISREAREALDGTRASRRLIVKEQCLDLRDEAAAEGYEEIVAFFQQIITDLEA